MAAQRLQIMMRELRTNGVVLLTYHDQIGFTIGGQGKTLTRVCASQGELDSRKLLDESSDLIDWQVITIHAGKSTQSTMMYDIGIRDRQYDLCSLDSELILQLVLQLDHLRRSVMLRFVAHPVIRDDAQNNVQAG